MTREGTTWAKLSNLACKIATYHLNPGGMHNLKQTDS